MIKRFWRSLLGYVVVTVKGRRVEGFLNRMAEAGIAVWDVERLSTGMLVARMEAGGMKRARTLCRHRGWTIAIADRVGFPFIKARLFRRKGLFFGAVTALVCLYIASGYIWFVEVEGTDGALLEDVLSVAERSGLKRSVRASSVDSKAVQLDLLLNIHDLSWAAVHIRGTRAVIEVAERSKDGVALIRPGDIVAGRDGIIEKIAVSQGHPLVREGDTVRRGDVIISGFIPPDDPRHRQLLREGKPPYVRADGIVSARVWYEGQSRVRLVVHQPEQTGRKSWKLGFSVGDRTIQFGRGAANFDAFEEAVWDWPFTLFSWEGRLTYSRYKESITHVTAVSEEEAKQYALDIAMTDFETQLPEGADILDGPNVEVTVLDEAQGPVVEAKVRAEVLEGIRSYRPYP